MVWRRKGTRPLPEPMMTKFIDTDIITTRPQWVSRAITHRCLSFTDPSGNPSRRATSFTEAIYKEVSWYCRWVSCGYPLRLEQNGRYFGIGIFSCIFFWENIFILNPNSLKLFLVAASHYMDQWWQNLLWWQKTETRVGPSVQADQKSGKPQKSQIWTWNNLWNLYTETFGNWYFNQNTIWYSYKNDVENNVDVMAWKYFPSYWPCVWVIHRGIPLTKIQ